MVDHIEFGNYSYQEITSREKLMEVLSYLLRIGDFRQYAGKTILIIPIFDAGLPDENNKKKYWYAMPIAEPIAKKFSGQESVEQIANCVIELANVMNVLHKQGIVHRDIKPSNIYFYKGGYCFGDFGLVDYPEKENLTKI